ncbi:MAG TPA: Uma2 family endonuclease [Terriglobia bacterium]|nr:Uma2 family endonuclease [Terriglobia bacterium]
MGTQTILTLEQFDQLPIVEGVQYELDEGEVAAMTEPMPRHNVVRDNVAAVLRDFVRPRKLGRVFAETGYQLSPETVRIPDVSFVPTERMRGLDLDRRIAGAPALAVEVVSPTDLAQELAHKIDQYLAAGVRVVWVVYPNMREVHVFREGGAASVLGSDDSLEAPDLLPGFAIRVGELFDDLFE